MDEQSSIRHRIEPMEDKLDSNWDASVSNSEDDKKIPVANKNPNKEKVINTEPPSDHKLNEQQAKLAKELIKLAATLFGKTSSMLQNDTIVKSTKCNSKYKGKGD